MKILDFEKEFDKCVELANIAIKKSQVFVYPTETLYGIGGNAYSKKVVTRICEIKNRTQEKPFSIILPDINSFDLFSDTSKENKEKIMKLLPGPYSIVCYASDFAKENLDKRLIKNGKIGIRIPQHYFCRWIVKNSGYPLITTSANISGSFDIPVHFDEIDKEILEKVDFSIDAKTTLLAGPSTVFDIEENKIIRLGKMHKSEDEIMKKYNIKKEDLEKL